MKFIKSLKFIRPIIRKFKLGNFEFRLNMNALKRILPNLITLANLIVFCALAPRMRAIAVVRGLA